MSDKSKKLIIIGGIALSLSGLVTYLLYNKKQP